MAPVTVPTNASETFPTEGVPYHESFKASDANQKPGHWVKPTSASTFKTERAGLGDLGLGFLSYGGSSDQPDTRDTAFALDDEVEVLYGGGFRVMAHLALGFKAVRGEPLIPWKDGELAVGGADGKRGWFKHPVDQQDAGFVSASITPPDGMLIHSAYLVVSTLQGGSTLDAGTAGDADGYIDGASGAALGPVAPITQAATEAALTVGDLISDSIQEDAAGDFAIIYQAQETDGATPIGWTTASGGALLGDVVYLFECEGARTVAYAEETTDVSVVNSATAGARTYARVVA